MEVNNKMWHLICFVFPLTFIFVCVWEFPLVSGTDSSYLDHDGQPLESFDHTSPHNVTVIESSYTYIKISWEPPLDNVSEIRNYQVKYSPHWDRRHETTKTVPAGNRTFYLKALMTGTIYRFYVVANYSSGKLPHSLTMSRQTSGYGKDNPCECNPWGSNSSQCNNMTGQCPCADKYTLGLQCDRCASGFFHHPNLGCEKCHCPEKLSNGSCRVDINGVVMCDCIDGHGGIVCQVCARGYHKRRGFTKCSPCQCNLNEDPHADLVCTNYGRCVACVFNTAGDHCELCLPGYEGDAMHRNCTAIVKATISHEAVVVIAVCLTIITVAILIIVFVLYTRWRRYSNKPFSLWTVQLGNDHENVNFSAIVNQHDPSSIDAELLANDEVQFAAKARPTLTFGAVGHEKT